MVCVEGLRADLPSIDTTCYAFAIPESHSFDHTDSVSLVDAEETVTRSYPLLAQLSAGLRHAYLAGTQFTDVRLLSDATMIVCTPTGSDFHVTPFDLASTSENRAVIVHSASSSSWLDMSRWRRIAPYGSLLSDQNLFPLSGPQRYAKEHSETLRALGASKLDTNRWRPPNGSARDDLEAYVLWQGGDGDSNDVELSAARVR